MVSSIKASDFKMPEIDPELMLSIRQSEDSENPVSKVGKALKAAGVVTQYQNVTMTDRSQQADGDGDVKEDPVEEGSGDNETVPPLPESQLLKSASQLKKLLKKEPAEEGSNPDDGDGGTSRSDRGVPKINFEAGRSGLTEVDVGAVARNTTKEFTSVYGGTITGAIKGYNADRDRIADFLFGKSYDQLSDEQIEDFNLYVETEASKGADSQPAMVRVVSQQVLWSTLAVEPTAIAVNATSLSEQLKPLAPAAVVVPGSNGEPSEILVSEDLAPEDVPEVVVRALAEEKVAVAKSLGIEVEDGAADRFMGTIGVQVVEAVEIREVLFSNDQIDEIVVQMAQQLSMLAEGRDVNGKRMELPKYDNFSADATKFLLSNGETYTSASGKTGYMIDPAELLKVVQFPPGQEPSLEFLQAFGSLYNTSDAVPDGFLDAQAVNALFQSGMIYTVEGQPNEFFGDISKMDMTILLIMRARDLPTP